MLLDSIAGNFFPCKELALQQGFGILLDFSTWFMTVSFVRDPFLLLLFLSSFLKSYVAATPSVTKILESTYQSIDALLSVSYARSM